MRTNLTLLAFITLIGVSPLIRFSLDDILLSRDTDIFVFLFIGVIVFFFFSYYSRVHQIVHAILPIFLIIGASSFLFGIFSPNLIALLFWILATCFTVAIWITRTGSLISGNTLIAIFIGCIGIYAQWGIAQFIVQHDLGMHILGESRLQVGVAGVASFTDASSKYMRAYGPFGHPNSFAGALLIGTILLYTLRSSSQLYSISMLSLYSIGLAVSFSRTALVGLAFVLLAYCIQKRLYILAVISLIPLLVFTPILLHRSFDPVGVAAEDRITGYAWLTDMATPVSLLRGYGIGNYESALVSHLTANHITYNVWDIAPVHSAPLLLFTEFGVVLGGIIAVLVVRFFKSYFSPILIALLPPLILDHYFITQIGPLLLLITCTVIVVQYRDGYRTH